MSKAKLIELAKRDLQHGRAGTMHLADDIYQVPAAYYSDRTRWQSEIDQIFLRIPLLLGATAEVPEVGDYKTLEAVGTQVLLTRTRSGEAKAFVNMCAHRGAKLVEESNGNAHKFTCPYHGWTFSPNGELVAVYSAEEFGEIDKSCHGLTELPCLERAGLIWGILRPNAGLDIEQFLSGYDEMLEQFGFTNWHHAHTQAVNGPNWKVAYDGYLDYYHLPILHRNSFGTDIGNKANYYYWGPHTHLGRPDTFWADYENLAEEEWPLPTLLQGVWTIFPHVSIASFAGGGRSVMISQLFPGDSPGTSTTNQIFLMEQEPDTDQLRKEAAEQFEFLKFVVEKEDYATGLALQKNLETGARSHVLFGRNEEGGQAFHRWVDDIVNADDEELPGLFSHER